MPKTKITLAAKLTRDAQAELENGCVRVELGADRVLRLVSAVPGEGRRTLGHVGIPEAGYRRLRADLLAVLRRL